MEFDAQNPFQVVASSANESRRTLNTGTKKLNLNEFKAPSTTMKFPLSAFASKLIEEYGCAEHGLRYVMKVISSWFWFIAAFFFVLKHSSNVRPASKWECQPRTPVLVKQSISMRCAPWTSREPRNPLSWCVTRPVQFRLDGRVRGACTGEALGASASWPCVRAFRGAASGVSILAAHYGNDEKTAARDGRQLVRLCEACRDGERRHVGFSAGTT